MTEDQPPATAVERPCARAGRWRIEVLGGMHRAIMPDAAIRSDGWRGFGRMCPSTRGRLMPITACARQGARSAASRRAPTSRGSADPARRRSREQPSQIAAPTRPGWIRRCMDTRHARSSARVWVAFTHRRPCRLIHGERSRLPGIRLASAPSPASMRVTDPLAPPPGLARLVLTENIAHPRLGP